MIDLHTHLLHNIDDGASCLEISLDYIKEQANCGVNTIVLTPHFRTSTANLVEFCQLRSARYEELLPHAREHGVSLLLGSEVMCEDRSVLQLDLRQLCIRNTNYILLEFWPTVSRYTMFYIVEAIVRIGLIPILAHVERYNILNGKPELLFELVQAEALLQVNAVTILDDSGYYRNCIKKGLIQLVASDTHATQKRPNNLHEAYELLKQKKINTSTLKENAKCVIENRVIDTSGCRKMRRICGVFI